jgi:hypothetical protein
MNLCLLTYVRRTIHSCITTTHSQMYDNPALFHTWQASAAGVVFFYSTYLNLYWQLVILCVTCVLGTSSSLTVVLAHKELRGDMNEIWIFSPVQLEYIFFICLSPFLSYSSEQFATVYNKFGSWCNTKLREFCVITQNEYGSFGNHGLDVYPTCCKFGTGPTRSTFHYYILLIRGSYQRLFEVLHAH